ncbi:MAG: PAAR domain-containing protein [Candidatus Omnitrophica bacterium]|nr:PAAR domain-containing protein [Candidatus Omnitrophota bacterium]
MSLGICRLNDICTGHGCFPPRKNVSGSNTVFVNGLGVHRKTDSWQIHRCRRSSHSGRLSQGSSTVYVEGLSIGRKNDQIDCGSRVMTCSSDCFSG